MNAKEFPLYTALITPMNEDSSVNLDELIKLIRMQEESRVGVLVLGSTGESLNLSLSEKKEIIERVSSESFDIPLMIGVGGINLEQTLEWVEYLNSYSFDSYLLVTPLYAKPGDIGQKRWFKALLDKSSRDCVLYNVPGRTGTSLSLSAVKELNSHPNFKGIKEASGSVEKFSEYREACSNQALFCGDDGLMPDFARVGAHGLISVASNVWPSETLIYVKRAVDKNLTEAEEKMWADCADTLFLASNPIPAKRIMFEKKMISNSTLRAPLDSDDLKSASELLDSDTKITNWSK